MHPRRKDGTGKTDRREEDGGGQEKLGLGTLKSAALANQIGTESRELMSIKPPYDH